MTLARRRKSIHTRGDCPDHLEGQDCDGVGFWTIDPFDEDVYGIETWGWWCRGAYHGAVMDT